MVPPRLLRRRHAARLGARTPNARSTRSRRAGRCSPAPATPSASRTAMDALDAHLVRREHGLIQLLDPPFDKSALEPGLHQGLRARRARERRPVHARRDLGGDGVRRAGRQPSARGSCSRMINPVNHARHADGDRHLQGRALRRRGRRLRRRAAHRPRRLDLVHRLGRLDVPADAGIAAGPAARRRQAAHRALPAGELAGIQAALPLPRHASTTSRWCAMKAAVPSTSFPWSTIAGNTGSR